jgi:ubiquinone/menaquinone biosynthesis C-methylase UbiE
VAAAFARWGVLGGDRRALEIGCGIGRFQAALAPQVAAAHGIDVSPAMITAARHRCSGLDNVVLALSSGRDLALYRDRSFHFVFAVDSFPYIHHAGAALVEAHFREAVRVLLPGGELGIFNYSYRDDPAADRREFARLCREHGLQIVAAGEQPFRLWDGVAFRARRR